MDERNELSQKDYIKVISELGGPSRPIYAKLNTWDETTRQLEDSIRENAPFEGTWQSYLSGLRIIIPNELRPLLASGGVITFSNDRHLWLFGQRHWTRMNRIISKQVGPSPVNNDHARHIYSHMYRFSALNEDGSIDVPLELLRYAGITGEVVIIGMMFYAEIHDKASYVESEKPEKKRSLLSLFRKLRYQ